MTDRRPAISVIIPTFQRRDRVLALLNALTRQDLSADELEVIVAVDGSTDGTGEAVAGAKWPFALRVREQPNRGPAAARNLGARESRAPILALLDDDTEPVPEFLREHLAIQRRALGCITIGPVPIDTGPRATSLQRYRASTFASRYDRLRRPGGRPTVTDGCLGNCTVTREQFLEVGGFDESFRRYGLEDFDLVRLRHSFVVGSTLFSKRTTGLACARRRPVPAKRSGRRLHVEGPFGLRSVAGGEPHSTTQREYQQLVLSTSPSSAGFGCVLR